MHRFITNPSSRNIALNQRPAAATKKPRSPAPWVRRGTFNCENGGWKNGIDFPIPSSLVMEATETMAGHDGKGFIHREVRDDESESRFVINIIVPA